MAEKYNYLFLLGLLLLSWATILSSSDGILKTSDHWGRDPLLFLFYFSYFCFGSVVWRSNEKGVLPLSRSLYGLSFLLLGTLSLLYLKGVQNIYTGHGEQTLWISAAHSLLTLGFSVILFRGFMQWNLKSFSKIRFLSDSSYTIYLIHPIFIALLVPLVAGEPLLVPHMKPIIVFTATLGFSLLSYGIFVRCKFLGRFV